MVRLTKWEKIELLKIYKRERMDQRCLITQTLIKQANEFTITLDSAITELKKQLHKLEEEKTLILKEKHLNEFDSTSDYTCKISVLHPTLIKFDKVTNLEIQKIIRGE